MRGTWFLIGGLRGSLSKQEHRVFGLGLLWVTACGLNTQGIFRGAKRAPRCRECVAELARRAQGDRR